MASKDTGVDSASCGFANNPFLQKMGKKKVIARHRAATMPSISSNKSAVKPQKKISPKITTKSPSNVESKSTTTTNKARSKSEIKSENQSKASPISIKSVSKVAALSASLSSKGISYGQTRPATKPKPFKSAASGSKAATFERPTINKRRPKTKKIIDIDSDSDSDKETNKEQIIQDLKQQIDELKAKQTEENKHKNEQQLRAKNAEIEQLRDENTALKQEIDKIRREYNQQFKQLKCENVSLQNQIIELNKSILILKQENQHSSPKTDDDIVIVDTEQAPSEQETLEMKSEETLKDAVDLRIDSNYKLIKKEQETNMSHEEQVNEAQNTETNVTTKGLFDDVIEEDGLFRDKPLFATDDAPKKEKRRKLFENPLPKHGQNTKENVIQSEHINEENDPLLTENNQLFEDILNEKGSERKAQETEKDAKKARKVKDIFAEDEDANDLFAFVTTNDKRTEAIQEKKQRLSSLFDSDDDDDDLFNFNKELDEDTINID